MQITDNASLLPYNTFGIDVRCRRIVVLEESVEAMRYCDHHGRDEAQLPLVLGGGSNMVFTSDIDRTVLVMRNQEIQLHEECGDEVIVMADAGVVWADFVDHCIAHGWHGLENLAGIPGTVGASAVQNIGAYGAEAKDVIHFVSTCGLSDGAPQTYYHRECQFGYRTSRFKTQTDHPRLVLAVAFKLRKKFTPNLTYRGLFEAITSKGITAPTARQVADTVIELRNSKLPDPRVTGSAGSFFKNPVVPQSQRDALLEQYPALVSFPAGEGFCKLAAGWLIEQCGWKGRSIGRAGVWEKQALVLCNRGGCTGQEVKALAEAIQKDVRERFGVQLEPEAIII